MKSQSAIEVSKIGARKFDVVQKSAIDVRSKFEPHGTEEGGDKTHDAIPIKMKGVTILGRQ
jgi:hypothetical protein